jgi:hypothetical protein
MKSYDAQATINATPERIWKLLTDAPGYPSWNPTVERIEGRIAPGETITVVVKVNPGRTFPVKVTQFQPGKRMVWSGGMPLGLFRGERTYTLEPAGDGATRFTMREEYTGPLLPMIWKSIPDLGPAFQEFATGLKAGAEKAQ